MLTLTEDASTAVHDLTTRAGLPDTGGLLIAESDAQAGGFELALVAASRLSEGEELLRSAGSRSPECSGDVAFRR